MTPVRDRIACGLMLVLGAAALVAAAAAVRPLGTRPADRVGAEAWRMLAYPVFAGLFALLGVFPRRMPGLWELVIYHKGGVAVFLLVIVQPGTVGASIARDNHLVGATDAVIALVILVAYLLAEGWRAWLPRSSPRRA